MEARRRRGPWIGLVTALTPVLAILGPFSPPLSAQEPDPQGYWLAASDGGVFAFGDAQFYGSMAEVRLNVPVVEIASTPTDRGYWLAAADGGVFAFGDAGFFGSMAEVRLNAPVVDMAPTPSGKGYWLAASDGGVFAFGDAPFLGSASPAQDQFPVLAIAPTPSGNGYHLIDPSGGDYRFGDAQRFHRGCSAEFRPAVDAVALGRGIWIVNDRGWFCTQGDAAGKYAGDLENVPLAAPVVGFSWTDSLNGYWMAAADGGVFAFGDARFRGSLAGRRLNAPVVGIAGTG